MPFTEVGLIRQKIMEDSKLKVRQRNFFTEMSDYYGMHSNVKKLQNHELLSIHIKNSTTRKNPKCSVIVL